VGWNEKPNKDADHDHYHLIGDLRAQGYINEELIYCTCIININIIIYIKLINDCHINFLRIQFQSVLLEFYLGKFSGGIYSYSGNLNIS
jgi:hypothetical protein